MIGQKFGKLEVVAKLKKRNDKGLIRYRSVCQCGNTVKCTGSVLRMGRSTSCGCSRKKHNHSGNKKSKTYRCYHNMINRCYDRKNKSYKDYGSRGIKVCSRWRGKDGFINFLEDMGEAPKNLSIDRINNSKGYTPKNCKWSTGQEQNLNSRRNVIVEYKGAMMPLSKAAVLAGLKPRLVFCRRYIGFPESEWFKPVGAKLYRN